MAFMRALSKRESDLNPNLESGARGLMQVVSSVRESYNQRKGASYTANDLFDPEINVKIASDLLNRIIIAYGKHPSRNMKEDWANPEFVKLLVAGWNSGYSEAAGVGKVAKYLEGKGIEVTHDAVFQNAAAAGGTQHLQNPAKRSWQKTVSDLYYQQPDWRQSARFAGTIGIIIAGWAAYRLIKAT